ncbi:MAG: hypothetical protein ACLP0J_27555 [Solirubrobacteraceae bacterium]
MIPIERVLGVVADFHGSGGASLARVAWELCVDIERVVRAWERARAEGLIRASGHDEGDGELWRLTPGGWAALSVARELRFSIYEPGAGALPTRRSP